nr:pentapeptide repeat-containing protein [Planktothrix sp. FACHB-1355]
MSRWKTSNFDRNILDNLVGKFYGHTDLRGIILPKENLSGVDLNKVDLYAANLENAMLKNSNLTDSYLSEANIKGTCFDWSIMDGVFLDNVDFDNRTSFTGVNLSAINFTLAALLQDLALGQARIINLEKKRPILAFVLKNTCDYGRSFPRFFLSCAIVILVFSLAYTVLPGSLAKIGSANSLSFWDNLYFSMMTFTTSSTDIQPISILGKILVAIETATGYLLTGLLVAILVKRTIGD